MILEIPDKVDYQQSFLILWCKENSFIYRNKEYRPISGTAFFELSYRSKTSPCLISERGCGAHPGNTWYYPG